MLEIEEYKYHDNNTPDSAFWTSHPASLPNVSGLPGTVGDSRSDSHAWVSPEELNVSPLFSGNTACCCSPACPSLCYTAHAKNRKENQNIFHFRYFARVFGQKRSKPLVSWNKAVCSKQNPLGNCILPKHFLSVYASCHWELYSWMLHIPLSAFHHPLLTAIWNASRFWSDSSRDWGFLCLRTKQTETPFLSWAAIHQCRGVKAGWQNITKLF